VSWRTLLQSRPPFRFGKLSVGPFLRAGCCWLAFGAAVTVAQPQDFAYTILNGSATITAYHGVGGAVVIPGVLNGSRVSEKTSLRLAFLVSSAAT
jgi:hypothetical protein